MRKFPEALTQLTFMISQGAATLVGCALFTVGFSGVAGMVLYPIDTVSFLALPSGLGVAFDQKYWALLGVVGVWLVLFVAPRLAAITAGLLIGAKWIVLNDFFSELPS